MRRTAQIERLGIAAANSRAPITNANHAQRHKDPKTIEAELASSNCKSCASKTRPQCPMRKAQSGDSMRSKADTRAY